MVKYAVLVASLVLVLLSSCAATLSVRGTSPTHDNAGTCTTPTLAARPPGAVVTVHVSASGPVTFEDSLTVAGGATFTFTRAVPAGVYAVRAWASDAGGAGCDTSVTLTVKDPPWRVRF